MTDWSEALQARRRFVLGVTLLLVAAVLLVSCLRNPVALDAFWHMQMGRDWLVNGLSPWVDHYSYTYAGHPIANPPVAFEALLYGLTDLFGLRGGFTLLRLLAFGLAIAASFKALRDMHANVLVTVVTLLMIAHLLQFRVIVRPELLSFSFAVLTLILYFRAPERLTARHAVPMALLMLIWTNYHSSIVGYVILAGHFLDSGIRQVRQDSPPGVWLRWAGWGALIFAVGFVNPAVQHPVIEMLTFPAQWKELILEYHTPFRLLGHAGVYVVILIALALPILAWRLRRWGDLLIWGVLVYAGATIFRMFAMSGLVITLLTAHLVTQAGRRRNPQTGGWWESRNAMVLSGLLSVVLLFALVSQARFYMVENRHTSHRYPAALIRYMDRQKIDGPVFNDYSIGGYLIWTRPRRSQVFIDGRTQILYPLHHLQTYIRATRSPPVLKAQLERYHVDQVIWLYDAVKNRTVYDMGGFGLDFMDQRYALYRRGKTQFDLLGLLLAHPACWRPDQRDELMREQQGVRKTLPNYSPLYPFADFVAAYARAPNGLAFLSTAASGSLNDDARRFAAFRYLAARQYPAAVRLFSELQLSQPADFLAAAWALLAADDSVQAARWLERMSSIDWDHVAIADRRIQYGLYQRLARIRKLTAAEQAVADAARGRVTAAGQTLNVPGRVQEAFCERPGSE